MIAKLIELLGSIVGEHVYMQGTFPLDEEYPSTFFTYWVFDAPENSHYDNNAISCIWGIWIYAYSNDPQKLEEISLQAKKLLKENGFTVTGKPVNVKSDEPSHTGNMLTIYGLENYMEE